VAPILLKEVKYFYLLKEVNATTAYMFLFNSLV